MCQKKSRQLCPWWTIHHHHPSSLAGPPSIPVHSDTGDVHCGEFQPWVCEHRSSEASEASREGFHKGFHKGFHEGVHHVPHILRVKRGGSDEFLATKGGISNEYKDPCKDFFCWAPMVGQVLLCSIWFESHGPIVYPNGSQLWCDLNVGWSM